MTKEIHGDILFPNNRIEHNELIELEEWEDHRLLLKLI